jgi:antitoxin MazE
MYKHLLGGLMISKIQKWGNSQGLRFPVEVLRQAALSVGDEVKIIVTKEKIVLKRAVKTRGKYNLKELVAKMPKKYKPQEEDWGKPIGKEVW